MSYLKSINYSTMTFIDRTAIFFTILAYTIKESPVTPDIVFPMVQYFNIMQFLLVYTYPRAMSNAAEARVSIKRIEVIRLSCLCKE